MLGLASRFPRSGLSLFLLSAGVGAALVSACGGGGEDASLIVPSSDGAVSIEFPPGSLPEGVSLGGITVEAIEIPPGGTPPPIAEAGPDELVVGPERVLAAYRLEPSGLQLSNPAILRIPLPASSGDALIALLVGDDGTVENVPLTIAPGDGGRLNLQAEIGHFSEVEFRSFGHPVLTADVQPDRQKRYVGQEAQFQITLTPLPIPARLLTLTPRSSVFPDGRRLSVEFSDKWRPSGDLALRPADPSELNEVELTLDQAADLITRREEVDPMGSETAFDEFPPEQLVGRVAFDQPSEGGNRPITGTATVACPEVGLFEVSIGVRPGNQGSFFVATGDGSQAMEVDLSAWGLFHVQAWIECVSPPPGVRVTQSPAPSATGDSDSVVGDLTPGVLVGTTWYSVTSEAPERLPDLTLGIDRSLLDETLGQLDSADDHRTSESTGATGSPLEPWLDIERARMHYEAASRVRFAEGAGCGHSDEASVHICAGAGPESVEGPWGILSMSLAEGAARATQVASYHFAFEMDGDDANGYVPPPGLTGDPLTGADVWIELRWDPTGGGWSLGAYGSSFAPLQTNAIGVVHGNEVSVFVPSSELPSGSGLGVRFGTRSDPGYPPPRGDLAPNDLPAVEWAPPSGPFTQIVPYTIGCDSQGRLWAEGLAELRENGDVVDEALGMVVGRNGQVDDELACAAHGH